MKKVFFLTNNNYHEIDMQRHLSELQDYEVNLIRVPHTLEGKNIEGIDKTWTFSSPFAKGFLRSVLHVHLVFKIHAEIHKSLDISPKDVLLIYTEFEPLNQYIAKLFKDAGARVYVLDEGLGTYLTYSQNNDTSLPAKNKLKLFWFKYVLGYKWMKVLFYNRFEFPQMLDSLIDGVLLYRDVNIKREIPLTMIARDAQTPVNLDEKTCVFLNSDMYSFYISWDNYIREIQEIMGHLVGEFDTVYFKFHPRENQESREYIKKGLSEIKGISFLQEDEPIELCVTELKAKYAVSYLSTSLISLMDYGIQPVYLLNCMPSCTSLAVTQALKPIFLNMGIVLPSSLQAISSAESYCMNNQKSGLGLVDFLGKNDSSKSKTA